MCTCAETASCFLPPLSCPQASDGQVAEIQQHLATVKGQLAEAMQQQELWAQQQLLLQLTQNQGQLAARDQVPEPNQEAEEGVEEEVGQEQEQGAAAAAQEAGACVQVQAQVEVAQQAEVSYRCAAHFGPGYGQVRRGVTDVCAVGEREGVIK